MFLLYLEWSREVNFFCFLQAQSNEGNVGRISEDNKDKYVADLCNPYDINSQQIKHMIAGQQDLSFKKKKGTKYSIQVRTNRNYGLCQYIYPGNTL